MIIEVKTIIPHQRANTLDPSIEKMIYHRIERGGVMERTSASHNRWL
jgi:hypothetical protein